MRTKIKTIKIKDMNTISMDNIFTAIYIYSLFKRLKHDIGN